MAENQKRMYREGMGLDDLVSVTLPVHAWFGFIAAYCDTEWNCGYAGQIASAAQKEILDPVFLKEREAEMSAVQDQQRTIMASVIPGLGLPQIPPDISGLGGEVG